LTHLLEARCGFEGIRDDAGLALHDADADFFIVHRHVLEKRKLLALDPVNAIHRATVDGALDVVLVVQPLREDPAATVVVVHTKRRRRLPHALFAAYASELVHEHRARFPRFRLPRRPFRIRISRERILVVLSLLFELGVVERSRDRVAQNLIRLVE
jgi:hypothetical protein